MMSMRAMKSMCSWSSLGDGERKARRIAVRMLKAVLSPPHCAINCSGFCTEIVSYHV